MREKPVSLTVWGIVAFVLLTFIGYLYFKAEQGDAMAVGTLVFIGMVLIMVIVLTFMVMVLHNQKSLGQQSSEYLTRSLEDSAKVMNVLQMAQNRQNMMLLKQSEVMRHLPAGDSQPAQIDGELFDNFGED